MIMDFKEMIDAVAQFHKSFGQPVENKPTLGNQETMYEVAKLRYKLGSEELKEFYEAMVLQDQTEVFDAIVDQLYILLGTAHVYGMADALFEGFMEVHKSNMTKLDENGKPIYREDGKVIKSSLFKEPDLESILEKYSKK
jgi:predicted HAD superfamily Cof-like phosphohydrolase